MICWAVTGRASMVSREMQLRTVLADFHGRDSDALIAAGTGSTAYCVMHSP